MIKLIIFDLDGTLLNSIADLAEATNYALRRQGMPTHADEAFKYFVGDGVAELINRAVPANTESATKVTVHSDFSEYYGKHYADKTVTYPGINELLIEIKRMGIMLAVASNKPDEFTKVIISRHWFDTFTCVQGQQDGIPKKPDPQIAFAIMEKLGVTAGETLFIGDTNVDVMTAKHAGIRCVGCLWGFRTFEELHEAGADFIIEKPEEIVHILENLKGANT